MIIVSGYPISNRENDICDTESYIRLNNCGYNRFITRDMTICRKEGRHDYQLIYIKKGTGYFLFDKKDEAVAEGSIILYHPGEPQCYTYLHKDSPEVYWVHFTGFGAAELIAETGIAGERVKHIGFSSTCIDLFNSIIRELQLKRPLFSQAAIAAFMELLTCMGRRVLRTENNANRDENIQKVIEYMNSDYNADWSIEKLSKLCSLSSYRFMHNFKTYTGVSAMEYLEKIRINKAKDLLADSTLSIKEISDAVGYSNPLYFSTVFKKVTGMSPSAFKRMTGITPDKYRENK